MFSKLLIFAFVFLLVFGVVASNIPSDYFTASYLDSSYMNQTIVEYYAMSNVTVFNQQTSFTQTYPSTHNEDLGLPNNEEIEFWWGEEYPYLGANYQVRHLTDKVGIWWLGWHRLTFTESQTFGGPTTELYANDLEWNWDSVENRSGPWWAYCPHISFNMFFLPTPPHENITHSWGNGTLSIMSSYEVDWNATSVNAVSILSSLFTFQSPNLGVPGTFGVVLNNLVAGSFTVIVAILIIKLVQSVVPFIRGVED